jgi:hypothetical protein
VYDLYGQRANIDVLAIVRPTVVNLVDELITTIRGRTIDEEQRLENIVCVYNFSLFCFL